MHVPDCPVDWEADLVEEYGPPDHEAAKFDADNMVANWEPQDCDEQDLNNARAYLALRAEVERLRLTHMRDTCAINHEPIRWSPAEDFGRCPVCSLRAELAQAKEEIERLMQLSESALVDLAAEKAREMR